MKKLLYIFAFIGCLGLAGCIEDGFTSAPSDQPVFSTDTLKMGVVFTQQVTTTHRFTVRNPHSKGINISRIEMAGANAGLFRLNVDGISATAFDNVEVRANDSIYVFVEATLPANGAAEPVNMDALINFTTNGVTRSVTVSAQGQDVERLQARTLDADTRFTALRPYQIFDSLVVAPGATLTLEPGTRLYFHDGAYMAVRGRLISTGTVERPVELCGDRTGNVVTNISFDLMSRQWGGLGFAATSTGNRLAHTVVRNTVWGVTAVGNGEETTQPQLYLENCRLRNSGDLVLQAAHTTVEAYGCEFAEGANGLVYLEGGNTRLNHCTLANYYLFAAIGGPALQLAHINKDTAAEGVDLPYGRARIENSIIYGLGKDISHGDLKGTQITLNRCLLSSNGTDDENFTNCLWAADPLYYTVRNEYVFDYRLRPESPAIGTADASLTAAGPDFYGLSRGTTPDLGAYVFTPPAEKAARK